jgi:hypothetical protein
VGVSHPQFLHFALIGAVQKEPLECPIPPEVGARQYEKGYLWQSAPASPYFLDSPTKGDGQSCGINFITFIMSLFRLQIVKIYILPLSPSGETGYPTR